MKPKLFGWHHLRAKVTEFIRDERGAAMVEYLLICGIMVPVSLYLFNPNNGFYQAERNQYNLTSVSLINPGP